MKRLIGPVLFYFLLFALLLSNFSASAQKTTVWVVRHAEKRSVMADDPLLTPAGFRRAEELGRVLKHEKISAVYVTNTKRSSLTAIPTANKAGVKAQVYTTTDYKAFAEQLLADNAGKNVLVVAHSNTVVPILAALGAPRPFMELADDDYDMLFMVTIKNGKAKLEISYYGDVHHTSIIPEEYNADYSSRYIRSGHNF